MLAGLHCFRCGRCFRRGARRYSPSRAQQRLRCLVRRLKPFITCPFLLIVLAPLGVLFNFHGESLSFFIGQIALIRLRVHIRRRQNVLAPRSNADQTIGASFSLQQGNAETTDHFLIKVTSRPLRGPHSACARLIQNRPETHLSFPPALQLCDVKYRIREGSVPWSDPRARRAEILSLADKHGSMHGVGKSYAKSSRWSPDPGLA